MKHLSKDDFRKLAKQHINGSPVAVERVKIGNHTMHQLVATKDIAKNTIVALYPAEIFLSDEVTIRDYAIYIYKRNYHEIPDVVGIPTKKALAEYKRFYNTKLAPIGMFVNEPTPEQKPNVRMKFPRVSVAEDYIGKIVEAQIVATKNIKKGDVLTWCYGCEYDRSYKTPCDADC